MDKEKIERSIIDIVGIDGVVSSIDELVTYEYDASLERVTPDFVVFPTTTEQISTIVKLASREKIPFLARGAGTALSGASVPVEGGIVISLSRMKTILDIDIQNMFAVVEPGCPNLDVTNAISDKGYYFAPEPSSQQTCTVGGNVAQNAGGLRVLKYGATANHILGLEVVLPNGDVITTGGKTLDRPGYDLTGLMTASEGTLGIMTKVVVRILHKPEAAKTILGIFNTIEEAGNTVSCIIGGGILPAALEVMDNLTIRAVEVFIKAGYPIDAGAALLVEVDGPKEGLEKMVDKIVKICKENNVEEIKVAKDEEERMLLWKGRKSSFGAMGLLGKYYHLHDGVVPRTKLPEVLQSIDQIAEKYGLQVASVFHAGDGNLHPIILFNEMKSEVLDKVKAMSDEILRVCVDVGGSISGEHGVGLEKVKFMPLIFNEDDLEVMRKIKKVFDPDHLCNRGKKIPAQPEPVEPS